MSGSHTFASSGTHTATVSLTDVLSGSTATTTASLSLSAGPLSVHALAINTIAGQAFTAVVAGYGPADGAAVPSALIDWATARPAQGRSARPRCAAHTPTPPPAATPSASA